jgi:GntP family gluconate:H+ symporter
MQTSFMHPPFGFALFYLRSVAPDKEYTDRVTGKPIAPVTTMQIYWGAVPFVVIQIVMVGLIIAFPGIVSGGLDKAEKIDLEKVRLEMQADMPAPEPLAPEEEPPGAPAATESKDMPVPPASSGADEDPMKALQESMAEEAKKKK